MKKILFLVLAAGLLRLNPLFAECAPTGAKICLSGDDTTQVWVNGSFLGSKDYCNLNTGCNPESLCFEVPLFILPGPDVCLAIKTSNLNPVMVFSSWELEVDCAGTRPFVVNSERNPSGPGVSLYWDPTGGSTCGPGALPPVDAGNRSWTDMDYHPSINLFTLTGERVTATTWSAAHIKNAANGMDIPYVSYDAGAAGSGPAQACGILYWRQVAHLPAWIFSSTPTVVNTLTSTLTSTPTFTPRPALTPTLIPRPIPTFTPTPSPRPRPKPRLLPTPLPTPWLRYAPSPQVRRYKVRPTATFIYRRLAPTPTMLPYHMPAYIIPAPARKKPAPVPAWLPKLDQAQTMVFQTPPFEVYVTFADGPGDYQLEIVDSRGDSVRRLMDKQVVAEGDSWVTWDGKDAKGRDVSPGQYYAIFYKDGRPLRSISVLRSGTGP